MESQGEVSPFVGGDFLFCLNHGDARNPVGDDVEAEVAVLELQVEPGSEPTV